MIVTKHAWPFSVLRCVVDSGTVLMSRWNLGLGNVRCLLVGLIMTMSMLLPLQLLRIKAEDFVFSSLRSTSCVIRLLTRPTGLTTGTSRPNPES